MTNPLDYTIQDPDAMRYALMQDSSYRKGGAIHMADGGILDGHPVFQTAQVPFAQYRHSIGMNHGGMHFEDGGQASLDQMRHELINPYGTNYERFVPSTNAFSVNEKPASLAYTQHDVPIVTESGGIAPVPRTVHDDRMAEIEKQLDKGVKPDWMSGKDFLQDQAERKGYNTTDTSISALGQNVLAALGNSHILGGAFRALGAPYEAAEKVLGSSMGLDPMMGIIGKTGELHSIPKAGQYAASRAAPVLSKIDQAVRSGYESGLIPQPGLSIKDVTPKALAPANEQGFYSPTEAAALNLQRKTGNGQAFLNDLLKQENVRPDEIKAMGLDTFLKGRTSVTAAEVQDYIAQNKLGLGEARYGALTKDISESRDAFKAYGQELANKYGIPEGQNISMYAGLKNIPAEEIAKYERLQNEWLDQQPKAAKFSGYQLPGGENYREVVLTLPDNKLPAPKQMDRPKVVDSGVDESGRGQFDVVVDGKPVERFNTWSQAQDHALELEQSENIKRNLEWQKNQKNQPENYRSSHWDEPNVLAHLRMSDRVTDGKKTLLVDEVQSDWHQAARDARTAEVDRLIKSGTSKEDAQKAVPKDYGYGPIMEKSVEAYYETKDGQRIPIGFGKTKEEAEANIDVGWKNMVDIKYETHERKVKEGVPDAPYKDDYYQLALRRAVKEAIDGGYDRVALPTGSRVAERFSLTKHINELHYSGSNLKAYDHNGKVIISETGVKPEDLPSYVGKETANKLLEQPKQGTLRSLIGQDLTVGDEGMKKYYDEIYPGYLKKFGKKYGASVGTTGVEVPPDSKAAYQRLRQYQGSTEYINGRTTWSEFLAQHPEAAKDFTEPLHYMDITPAMRKEFSTGIHMAKGGKVSFADSLDAMRHELTKAK